MCIANFAAVVATIYNAQVGGGYLDRENLDCVVRLGGLSSQIIGFCE
jgi:hypothetical protein